MADTTTFFSLLHALGSSDLRGPLEPLCQLGQTIEQDKLWPCLQLTETMLRDPVLRGYVEAVVIYCTSVEVCWADDMDWLVRFLQPPIQIQWSASVSNTRDWIAKWVELPITQMTLTWPSDATSKGEHLMSTLTHFSTTLTSLTLRATFSLEHLLAFAARSKLVHLDIERGTEPTFTPAMLDHAIHWLQSVPVETFRFWQPPMDPGVDVALRETFYSALFQRPTKELKISYDEVEEPEEPIFYPFSMISLDIDGDILTPPILMHFADVLPHSPALTHLRITQLHGGVYTISECTAALAHLLDKLALSAVTSLEFYDCLYLRSLDWRRLQRKLQRTSIQRLSLAYCRFERNGIIQFVQAIQNNNTIRDLDLVGNNLRKDKLTGLLNCNLHRTVPLDTVRIQFSSLYSADDKVEIHTLAKERGVMLLEIHDIED
ncbi:Aste57867_10890 [Aphanomyces stellatus]|uniref:Aste57867_10890 protein n=1 Tax=Aphanomyces stellatus TaxID=120398 RepID=A0A485KRH7_9STRA|nr:hypothetical protein As57867_010850 [Aphanomyces stellatus]VFT87758.1 Aste57867_10890 [Aphanomyces stellatus]